MPGAETDNLNGGRMHDTSDEVRIRTAGRSDRLAICTLLQQAWHSAGGARWDQLDALEGGCAALLACRGSQTVGLCLFDLRIAPVSRLCAVAVADREPIEQVTHQLWQSAEPYLRDRGVQLTYYLGEAPWLLDALHREGFQQANTLVSYERMQDSPTPPGHSGVRLRPVRAGDLAAVEEIDAASFPLLWRYPQAMLAASAQHPSRLIVAELDRRLVGYQVSSQESTEGQVTRLAVIPDYRRQGIGSRLLSDALNTFRRAQIRRVLLNTQADNLPAQRLYEQFGFRRSGEEFPVLQKSLTR